MLVFNEALGKLYLRDMATNSLMVYALDDFHFIEKLHIPFYATCFEQLDDAHFIWYVNAGLQNQGEFQKHLQVTDLDCHPVSSWVDVMKMPQRGIYNVMSYFTVQDAEVRFYHPFSGDYYSCSLSHPDLLQFAYSLRFEGMPFPSLDYVQAHRDNIVKDLEDDHYIQWCEVWKNSKTMLSYFGSGKTIYWGRYDMESASGWYIRKEQLKDDLGIGQLSRPKAIYKDHFVSFLSLEDEEWEALPEHSIVKQRLKKDSFGGNPIVLLYK